MSKVSQLARFFHFPFLQASLLVRRLPRNVKGGKSLNKKLFLVRIAPFILLGLGVALHIFGLRYNGIPEAMWDM